MTDTLIWISALALAGLLGLALALAGGVLLYALGLWARFIGQVLRSVALAMLAALRWVLRGLIALQQRAKH